MLRARRALPVQTELPSLGKGERGEPRAHAAFWGTAWRAPTSVSPHLKRLVRLRRAEMVRNCEEEQEWPAAAVQREGPCSRRDPLCR